MDGCSPATILVLSGKSPQEDALALSLKWRSDTVKLIDEEESETRVLVGSEAEGATFDPRTYMVALSTSRFVRLLILSPKIPSTHDLVSKNFAELSLGTVCVSDLQYKGREWLGIAHWLPPFLLHIADGRKLPFCSMVYLLQFAKS